MTILQLQNTSALIPYKWWRYPTCTSILVSVTSPDKDRLTICRERSLELPHSFSLVYFCTSKIDTKNTIHILCRERQKTLFIAVTSGAGPRAVGTERGRWSLTIMSDTCATHRSRVPRRSSGRIKGGATTVEDERGPGLDFNLCFVCGSRP